MSTHGWLDETKAFYADRGLGARVGFGVPPRSS
jgi:hypothetical protein